MTGDLDQLGGRYGVDLSLIDEVAGDVPQLPLELFGPWARWLDAAATDAGAPWWRRFLLAQAPSLAMRAG